MKNELNKVITNNLPATNQINQNAEKLYNIDKVEHITVINSTSTLDEGIPLQGNILDFNYYHLVVGGTIVDSTFIKVDKQRALCESYTEPYLRQKYATLTPEVINEIIKFPILVLPESSDYYGRPTEKQVGYVGVIEKIRKDTCDIVLKCKLEQSKPIRLYDICNIAFDLNIKSMDCAITELNRTHWAIKPINLIKELDNAGIDFRKSIF